MNFYFWMDDNEKTPVLFSILGAVILDPLLTKVVKKEDVLP
jgi:hypothetical protein